MIKNKMLVIIGDGEFAEIAYEYFTHDSDYDVHAFAVESAFFKNEKLNDLPVEILETLELQYAPELFDVFVAVTYTQFNRVRQRLFDLVKAKGYTCANYVSSHAFVWRNVTMGENCFIFEANVLQHHVQLENNIILWSGNHIGHRSVIRNHVYFSSHVVVSGYCDIGEYSFLGVNATLGDHVTIARDNLIGAGSVITKSTQPGLIYKGNPAEAAKISSYRYFKVDPPADSVG